MSMNLIGLMEVSTIYTDGNYYSMWGDIELDSRIDKQVLIEEIVNCCAQSIPMYNTVPTFKSATEIFFKKWKYQITQLMDTLEYEYNPIWNKDGKTTEKRQIERVREEGVSDNTNDNITDKRTVQENGSVATEVSAYNSSEYQPNNKDISSSTTNNNDTVNRDTDRSINTDENESTIDVFERLEQGNIGVTSTQSLIQEQRELMEFNIYKWIVEKYERELFLEVW